MSAFEWIERGDRIAVDSPPGGGLLLTIEHEGQAAVVALSDRAGAQLAEALAGAYGLNRTCGECGL